MAILNSGIVRVRILLGHCTLIKNPYLSSLFIYSVSINFSCPYIYMHNSYYILLHYFCPFYCKFFWKVIFINYYLKSFTRNNVIFKICTVITPFYTFDIWLLFICLYLAVTECNPTLTF